MILNRAEKEGQWEIYPFIHDFCNLEKEEDAFSKVLVPDVLPAKINNEGKSRGEMSMAAGEFLEVYSRKNEEKVWDCVVTCFFIDTAHSVIDYIECINKTLKIGGLWTNLGPLLYHYSDSADKI
jgi:carnosine N-methyltransferase